MDSKRAFMALSSPELINRCKNILKKRSFAIVGDGANFNAPTVLDYLAPNLVLLQAPAFYQETWKSLLQKYHVIILEHAFSRIKLYSLEAPYDYLQTDAFHLEEALDQLLAKFPLDKSLLPPQKIFLMAKEKIIIKYGLSEPEAHRLLLRVSMDLRLPLMVIAQQVLKNTLVEPFKSTVAKYVQKYKQKPTK